MNEWFEYEVRWGVDVLVGTSLASARLHADLRGDGGLSKGEGHAT